MTEKTGTEMTGETTRALSPDDLEAVIAIDSALSGSPRRGFFETRLRAALRAPSDHVYVGLESGGALAGYAMARLTAGEFGKPGARAALDAIGVDPTHQHEGAGQRLLQEVKAILRHKRVSVLESQVDWADRALLGFFGDAGFGLAPRMVLAGTVARMAGNFSPDFAPEDAGGAIAGDAADFSSPLGDQPGALAIDRIPVRAMRADELDSLIRIDRHLSGAVRRPYFERKLREMLTESGLRLSLVATLDGLPAGFVMARLDYGDFGVHPDFQGRGVGGALMAQLLTNLSGLQVESLRSEIAWNDTAMIAFLSRAGLAPTQRVALDAAL